MPIWVSAEISELKVNYSGHCYIDLVEKGADGATPQAQVRSVIWRSNYDRIAPQFTHVTGHKLEAGLKILAKVMVNYHEVYGFSLQIVDIDPNYTLGDIQRARQLTIEQLKGDGVWEMNKEAHMPLVLHRIAVVSSPQAAGYQDFTKELSRYTYDIRTTLFEAVMQGAAAEESITSALSDIADRESEFDAVVIIRGGGATSDLACFDSYHICSYITQFPLAVITGIGHDKDVSIADMVAHTSLKTPTAVAGWIVDRAAKIEEWLEGAAHQLRSFTHTATHKQHLIIEQLKSQLSSQAQLFLTQKRIQIGMLPDQIKDGVHHLLRHERQRLERAQELSESHSPEQILKLGFAVVRHGGQAVTNSKTLSSGDRLQVELANGTVDTIVE